MENQNIFTDEWGYEYFLDPSGRRAYLSEEAIEFHETRNEAKKMLEKFELEEKWEPVLFDLNDSISKMSREMIRLAHEGIEKPELRDTFIQSVNKQAEIRQLLYGYDDAMNTREMHINTLNRVKGLVESYEQVVKNLPDQDEDEYPVYPFDSDEVSTSCANYDIFSSCLLCTQPLLDNKHGQVIKLDPCLHCFHADCAQLWFATQKKKCPIMTCGARATGYYLTESFFRRHEEKFPWQS